MSRGRFSVSDLVGAVGLCAVGMSFLMFASSPWAGASLSVTLAALTLAPLGIIYRRGARRASWVGFALCGWAYMALSSGPWSESRVRPRLVTSRLLEAAYPRLVPPARRPDHLRYQRETFVLPAAAIMDGLTVEELNRAPIDVWAREGDGPPVLLAEGVMTSHNPAAVDTIAGTALDVDRDQTSRLAGAKAYSRQFILRRHVDNPFAPMWSAPPVQPSDFEEVGHHLFGLLCACLGGAAGRYAFATDHETPRSPTPTREPSP